MIQKSALAFVLFLAPIAFGQAQQPTQDAAALEAQYKTCSQHYIPAEKCTPEIYQQLKEKDNAPLDPATATALSAAKDYQSKLRIPDSMKIIAAYVTEKNDVCFEVAGQNAMGGMTTSKVVYSPSKKHGSKWIGLNQNEFSPTSQPVGFGIGSGPDAWTGFCYKGNGVFHAQGLKDGLVDVTDKVNQALREGK